MRYKGKITTWKDDQGYGFISPNGGGAQVFVHIKSFLSRTRRPLSNESVTYKVETDSKGRAQAREVAFAGERLRSVGSSVLRSLPLLFATSFLAFVAAMAFADKLPLATPALYLTASTVAFVAYALDKSAAKRNKWRTQESTLHLFALAGGWPGALVAQRLLRHKSKKGSFQVTYWVTVILNCTALALLSSGSGAIRSILGT